MSASCLSASCLSAIVRISYAMMSNERTNKPPCRRDDALVVLRRLRDNGHVAYFAGGCVRDLLLGHEPADWDVATDAVPDRVRELFPRSQSVGAAFGVILVREGPSVIEVATFRADADYSDGRRPDSVRFTSADQDAQRRDFTINGLFYDPIDEQVIDFVGGRDDVQSRILRAIGDPEVRFAEDYLRMLRAVRFAARFGLTIEPSTRASIVANAHKLPRISPERIADELRRMLVPPTRGVAWRLLAELRLLSQVFRHLPDPPVDGAFDAGRSLVLRLPDDRAVSFGLVLAAGVLEIALHRRQTDDLRAIVEPRALARIDSALRRMLRYSNDESETMKGTLDFGMLLQDVRPTVAMLKRFLARRTSGDARVLLGVLRSRGPHAERIDWLLAQLEELSQEEVAPPPLITGDDLIAEGWRPGRLFKRVLDEVYDAQLESRISTRDDAMNMARQLAGRHAPT